MAAGNPHFSPINQLPDHILVEIFLKLEGLGGTVTFPYDGRSLLPPIASVCSRWRRLYFEPKMWRSKVVDVYGSKIQLRPDSQFFTVLNRMAGEIQKLAFPHCYSLRLLPTFASVERLIFDSFESDLGLLVDKFPVVQSVDIGHSVEVNDAVLLQMASGWENLRKFKISSAARCTGATGTGLIRFVQLANHIESLNVDGYLIRNLTDSDFDEITMALGVGLKSITFGSYQGLLSGLAIESLVRNCPNVEQIGLNMSLPLGRLTHLAQLKVLKLNFQWIEHIRTSPYSNVRCQDCQGFEDLFSRPLCQLRSFVAKGVGNLTDSHLELIANCCPQLESLILSVSETPGIITDSGLAHIINKCRHLRILTLEGFPLLAGRSFIGAAAKLPNLSRLQLYECENIDAEMVRRAFVTSTRLQIRSDLDGPWDLRRFNLRRLSE